MDKQTKTFYIKIAIAFAVIAFLVYRSPKSTGSIYMPDMAYSRAYETYGDNGPIASIFGSVKSNMASLLPVANTFSRNSLPALEEYQKEKSSLYSYQYTRFFKNTDEDKARAGIELSNPHTNTKEILARGEAVYKNQCAICHGKTGMGDGPLIVREDGSEGAYKAVPPAYSDRLKGMPDGSIFHSITYGKNLMGGYASHVNADDRWKLVCYIKELGGFNEGAGTAAKDTTKNIASATTTPAVSAK
jgi:mono/diheme cytochrome c family protein